MIRPPFPNHDAPCPRCGSGFHLWEYAVTGAVDAVPGARWLCCGCGHKGPTARGRTPDESVVLAYEAWSEQECMA